jgi:hypothetical protein
MPGVARFRSLLHLCVFRRKNAAPDLGELKGNNPIENIERLCIATLYSDSRGFNGVTPNNNRSDFRIADKPGVDRIWSTPGCLSSLVTGQVCLVH